MVLAMADDDRARIAEPSDDEVKRLRALLRAIGGPNVQWGAQQVLDAWVAETRLEAERVTAKRMLVATWVLAIATVGLVVATVGLIVVTFTD
jgi:hypothetical protein